MKTLLRRRLGGAIAKPNTEIGDVLRVQSNTLTMQGNALTMQVDTLIMQGNTLIMQGNALIMQGNTLIMQVDAMRSLLSKLITPLTLESKSSPIQRFTPSRILP